MSDKGILPEVETYLKKFLKRVEIRASLQQKTSA
jgi:hypothetical protein